MCTKADRDELLAELRRVGRLVDGSPRVADMREHGEFSAAPFYTEFGTWSDALEVVGFEKNHNQNTSRKAMLAAIREMTEDGEPPTGKDMTKEGPYAEGTYHKHFETFAHAVREAGFEPRREMGRRIELECEICGDSFKVRPSDRKQRFCGMGCFAEHREGKYTGEDHWRYVERPEQECKQCGEIFQRAPWRVSDRDQFCSQECYYEWRAEHAESFDYGEGWNEEKREGVREKYNRRCQSCGMTEREHKQVSGKKLAVHHITPAKQIDDAQERNAVANLIPLCCSCHNDWEGIPLKPTLLDP